MEMCKISTVFLVFLLSLVTTVFSTKNQFENVTTLDTLTKCQEDLQKVSNLPTTLLLMADASSKFPAGVASGNIYSLGDFDQCFTIKEVSTKFCFASVKFKLPFQEEVLQSIKNSSIPQTISNLGESDSKNTEQESASIGVYICALKSCNASELNEIFKGMFGFNDELCSTNEWKELDSLAIAAIFVFSLVILIALVSTIYDVYLIHMGLKTNHPAFLVFSLYSNGRKLFKVNKNQQQIGCLHGIKSLSMLWVMLGHTYVFYSAVPVENAFESYEWLKTVQAQYIVGTTVPVDTFLTLSGFLTMYTFQGVMQKGTKFNIPLYYLHHYVRLTPALAAMVLATGGIFNYLGDGPLWHHIEATLVKQCRSYWWSTLLYIQNYVNPNELCISPTWYLSLDMQIFFLSPLFLVVMRTFPIWGNVLLGTLSLMSMISSFIIGWIYEFKAEVLGNLNENFKPFLTIYYYQIYTRITPYLFGIILGYYVYKFRQNKRFPQLSTGIVVSIWTISLVGMAGCAYAGRSIRLSEYNRLANVFYMALLKPVWSLCICGVIFACSLDYGGLINTFLKLPIFEISSRLCYCIYLVHYQIIPLGNLRSRQTFYFSDFNAIYKFCGTLILSIVCATALSLFFEFPILGFEKILSKKH